MAKHMPCGPEVVRHYGNPQTDDQSLVHNLDKWFRYAEVDIHVPPNLHDKFAEMCPLFNNREVDEADVPQEMIDYLTRINRKRVSTRKLLGTLSADKILKYAPLLQWYIDNCLKVTALYHTIDYELLTTRQKDL